MEEERTVEPYIPLLDASSSPAAAHSERAALVQLKASDVPHFVRILTVAGLVPPNYGPDWLGHESLSASSSPPPRQPLHLSLFAALSIVLALIVMHLVSAVPAIQDFYDKLGGASRGLTYLISAAIILTVSLGSIPFTFLLLRGYLLRDFPRLFRTWAGTDADRAHLKRHDQWIAVAVALITCTGLGFSVSTGFTATDSAVWLTIGLETMLYFSLAVQYAALSMAVALCRRRVLAFLTAVRECTAGSVSEIVQQYLSIQADAQALTRRPRWLIEINSVLGVLGLLLFLCFLLLNPTWFHDNRTEALTEFAIVTGSLLVLLLTLLGSVVRFNDLHNEIKTCLLRAALLQSSNGGTEEASAASAAPDSGKPCVDLTEACLALDQLESFPMVLTVLSFGIDTNRAIRLVSSFLLAVVPLAMRVER